MTRLRALLAVVACVLATTALAACEPGEPREDPPPSDAASLTLEVISSDWSGWESPTAMPSATTQTVTAVDGATITVASDLGDIVLVVESLDDGGIELSSSRALVVANPGGGYDLDATQTEFTLEVGETLELLTPTLDAGTGLTLTLTS